MIKVVDAIAKSLEVHKNAIQGAINLASENRVNLKNLLDRISMTARSPQRPPSPIPASPPPQTPQDQET